jgi:hypothetical protein
MPFGTAPGAPTGPATTHLAAGKHLVKVVPEAPYRKNGEPVRTMPVVINGSPSLQFVLANADGAIDFTRPIQAPPGTNWDQAAIDGDFNAIAAYSGCQPDAIDNGIHYDSERVFLRDLLNRGGPFWIEVIPDKKSDGKYTRFGRFIGPAGDRDVYRPWGERPSSGVSNDTADSDDLPF